MTSTNAFKAWMGRASPGEKKALATAAASSVAHLRQVAHGYRTLGIPTTSPELARKIELATGGAVLREDICPACRACELASIARSQA
jgi:DNA-binding transcriptional regulator YdaS (Cro superfamily)